MSYRWREGFHPPRGVQPHIAAKAIKDLAPTERTPEELVNRAKSPRHCLHSEFYAEDDALWARRGRVERARKIMGSIEHIEVVGGKEIATRVVEFVRTRWHTLDEIRLEPDLQRAYIEQTRLLLKQAMDKLERISALFDEDDQGAARSGRVG